MKSNFTAGPINTFNEKFDLLIYSQLSCNFLCIEKVVIRACYKVNKNFRIFENLNLYKIIICISWESEPSDL